MLHPQKNFITQFSLKLKVTKKWGLHFKNLIFRSTQYPSLQKLFNNKKNWRTRNIIVLGNSIQPISNPNQTIKFPLIANGNSALNLPAFQNHP